jgi:hypothetical protein
MHSDVIVFFASLLACDVEIMSIISRTCGGSHISYRIIYRAHIILYIHAPPHLKIYIVIIIITTKGIDQDDDEYIDTGSQDDEDIEDSIDQEAAAELRKEIQTDQMKMAQTETKELEAAKKERMELIAAERNKLAVELKGPNEGKATLEDKFQYLVGQSEVFAHFLAGE